jgi:hypothetical protein
MNLDSAWIYHEFQNLPSIDRSLYSYTRFQNYATSLKNTLTSNVSFMSQELLKIANVSKLSKDILNRI